MKNKTIGHYKPTHLAKLNELYQKGLMYREIAKELDISSELCSTRIANCISYGWMKKRNIVSRKRSFSKSRWYEDGRLGQLHVLHKEGKNGPELAKIFNVSVADINGRISYSRKTGKLKS